MTNPNASASIGSISHGTLRVEDLLSAFASELERLTDSSNPLVVEAEAVATLHASGWLNIMDGEEAADLVDELSDALNELSPPYCYFGTSEGDGSDYGFWPSMELIEELPRIQNVEGEDIPAEDHIYVNDHGNVTLYDAQGNVVWDIV